MNENIMSQIYAMNPRIMSQSGIFMIRKNKNIKIPQWVNYWADFQGSIKTDPRVQICYRMDLGNDLRKRLEKIALKPYQFPDTEYHMIYGITSVKEMSLCKTIMDYEKHYNLSIENLESILKILKCYNEDLKSFLQRLKIGNKKDWETDSWSRFFALEKDLDRDEKVLKWALKQKQKYGDDIEFVAFDRVG